MFQKSKVTPSVVTLILAKQLSIYLRYDYTRAFYEAIFFFSFADKYYDFILP